MSKKITLLLTSIAILGFSGCTDSLSSLTPQETKTAHRVNYDEAPQAKVDAFEIEKRKVGLSTQSNPNYKSPIAEVKAANKLGWFNNQMYRLWDRQITRSQYIAEGVSAFPTHRYEFTFIANGF